MKLQLRKLSFLGNGGNAGTVRKRRAILLKVHTGCSKKDEMLTATSSRISRFVIHIAHHFKAEHQEICYTNFQLLGFLENDFTGKKAICSVSKIFRTRLVSYFCWDGSNFLRQEFIFISYIEYLLRSVIMLSILWEEVSLS